MIASKKKRKEKKTEERIADDGSATSLEEAAPVGDLRSLMASPKLELFFLRKKMNFWGRRWM